MNDKPLDCLVIGAGPAGLTAAIYLARFHLDILVVDRGKGRATMIPCTRNHAGYPDGISGKELIDLKDTDGKPLIREFVAINDQAWVDYKWPDPISKKISQKTTYVVRVGHYLVGVGAYK